MPDRVRIRIAALVTAAFIGGLSLAGIAARHGPVTQQAAAAKAQTVSSGDQGGELDGE